MRCAFGLHALVALLRRIVPMPASLLAIGLIGRRRASGKGGGGERNSNGQSNDVDSAFHWYFSLGQYATTLKREPTAFVQALGLVFVA